MSIEATTYKYNKVRKKNSNRLICILWAYLVLFVSSSFILLLAVLRLQYSPESPHTPLYQHFSESEQKHFETFGWPFKAEDGSFNCSWLSETGNLRHLASGWTKSVYSFAHSNFSYALKAVNANGEDIRKCSVSETFRKCYELSSSKLLKEFILARELRTPYIVKVMGWCISGENVAMVTELCEPLESLTLLSMSFVKRLKISLDIARLVFHLANSPLGSVAINDFRRQQFVLCGSEWKLADLDDLSIEEPRCRHQTDCTTGHCTKGSCHGHNEMENVRRMFQHILSVTIALDPPPSVNKYVMKLFLEQNRCNAKCTKLLIENIFEKYCAVNRDCD